MTIRGGVQGQGLRHFGTWMGGESGGKSAALQKVLEFCWL